MEFPSSEQQDASPEQRRDLAGPSRLRHDSRSSRTAAFAKPYARPLLGGGALAESKAAAAAQASSSSSLKASGSQASLTRTAGGGGGGLLSSLGRAITKPLSWLTASGSKSDLPTTQAVPSLLLPSNAAPVNHFAQRRAVARQKARAEGSGTAGARQPSATLRNIGSRLAARGDALRNAGRDDIESHESSALRAPPPSRGLTPRGSLIAPPLRHGSSRLSQQPRNASGDTTMASPRPSPAPSSASAAVLAAAARRPRTSGGSVASAYGASPRASPYLRDASMGVPLDSHASPSSFAYGYGSERRYAGLTNANGFAALGHSPSAPGAGAPYSLVSRSPFALRGARSSVKRTSDAGSRGGRASTPSHGASLYNAMAVTSLSAAASRTPKHRKWSSLNIAPPGRDESDGELLVRQYAADLREHARAASAAPGEHRHTRFEASHAPETPSKLGKRSGDAHGEERDDVRQSARKRQMVWDKELGFISREDLKAMEPQQPIARNEAERVLNFLEGMRTPLGDARTSQPPITSRHLASVPVPLPSRERGAQHADARTGTAADEAAAPKIAPYSRALRSQAKAQHAAEASAEAGGMRARLRRSASVQPQVPAEAPRRRGRKAKEQDRMDEDERVEQQQQQREEAQAEQEQEEEEEEDPPTPPRRPVTSTRTSTRAGNQKASAVPPPAREASPQAMEEDAPAPKQQAPPQRRLPKQQTPPPPTILRSGRAVFTPSKPKNREPVMLLPNAAPAPAAAPAQAPLPAPKLAHTPIAAARADNFVVRADPTPDAPRARSNLRQGAEKSISSARRGGAAPRKSNHVGFSMDDDDEEDEEEEQAQLEQLEKIQLPKIHFPANFSFGDAPAPAPAPPAEQQQEQAQQNGDTQAQGTGLLGRLGAFAPAAESTTPKKSPPPAAAPAASGGFAFGAPAQTSEAPKFGFNATPATSEARAPAKLSFGAPVPAPVASTAASGAPPKFSFGGAPSTSAAADKPAFSFGASGTGSSDTSRAGTPAASFFAQPPASQAPKDEKNSGPPPNFFGKRAEIAPAPAAAAAAPAGSDKPFSFGPPKAAESTTPSASTSTGTSKPAFSFGAAPAAAAPTSSAFTGFGAAPASSESNKRSADDTDEPPAKKLNGSAEAAKPTATFSFGAPASTPAASPAPASTGFSFGAPAPAAGTEAPKPAFGGFGTPAASASSTPAKPVFSFGAAPTTPAAGSTPAADGMDESPQASANAAPSAAAPKFTGFGQPTSAAPSSSGFFGAAPTAKPATSAGGFTFNAPTSTPAAGASAPFGAASASGAFGKPASSGAAAPATSGFSFSGGSTGGFGGGFGASNAASSTPAAAPAGAFTFGAASAAGSVAGSSAGSRAASPFTAAPAPPAATGFGGFGAAPPASTPGTPGTAPSAFSFGQPAAAATPPVASASGAGFAFAVPSPGINTSGSGFSFGAPQAQPSPIATSGGGSPFVFGGGGGGAAAAPATPTNATGGFQFGAPAQAAPAQGAGAPQPPQTPGGTGMFNLGTASPSSTRPVKGIPRRGRTGR